MTQCEEIIPFDTQYNENLLNISGCWESNTKIMWYKLVTIIWINDEDSVMKPPSSGGDATQHTLIHSEGCGVPNYLPSHPGGKWHILVISTKKTLSSI